MAYETAQILGKGLRDENGPQPHRRMWRISWRKHSRSMRKGLRRKRQYRRQKKTGADLSDEGKAVTIHEIYHKA